MNLLKHSIGCLTAAFCAALITGCSDLDAWLGRAESINITADAGGSGITRTQIDEAGDSSQVGILWSPGDTIGVFGSATANAPFSTSITEAVPTATFSGTVTTDDAPEYAYYPYRADAKDMTAVPVTIDGVMYYTDVTSISASDIKVGNAPEQRGDAWHFTFRSMVAMLHFVVNADGVNELDASERLQEIQVEPAEDVDQDNIGDWTGEFTMNLSNPDDGLKPVAGEAAATLVVNLTNNPTLAGEVEAYACIAPDIQKGDLLQIRLITDKHEITLQVAAEQDLEAGGCYDIPLYLSRCTEENKLSIVDMPYESDENAPEILSFSFEVANNKGKILDKEAAYDETVGATQVKGVTEQALEVDGEAETISGCIPYLYDFTLVPTFTTSDKDAVVAVGGVEQTSGVTAQDFSEPVVYSVTGTDGATRYYTVSVTNTGLPVVVLTGGGVSDQGYKYANSDRTVYDTTSDMPYLESVIPSKESTFRETDKIAIYDKAGGQNLAEVYCGFRMRGNSTAKFPKKPIAVKLVKKAEVLGMAEHKRWCLLANWIDRSMIRNAVAFDIAKKIQEAYPDVKGDDGYGTDGTDGLVWNPSGRNVELVLNGVHAGNYFLCEQIKIGGKRLDIQDGFEDVLDDYNAGTGDAPTTANCGYLLEFNAPTDEYNTATTSHYSLPYQSKDQITYSAIWSYVTNYVQSIEDYLYAGNYTSAYGMLDINSVIDYWFVQEIAMNNEYRHPKSVYMYKNGTGKLYAGPVWDFDYQTFPNISNINKYYYYDGSKKIDKYDSSTLLHTLATSAEHYLWYPQLFQDETFKTRVKERWAKVYPTLLGVTSTIETLGQANKVSDSYNQKIWPIIGPNQKRPITTVSRPNYKDTWYIEYSGDEHLEWDALIENFKSVYLERLSNMNAAINAL